MAEINPHINFNGNAEEAFIFYQSVFGGNFTKITRFKDITSDNFPIPADEANKIMHIGLSIGQSFLFANDILKVMGQVNENENRSKIVVTAESKEEACDISNGLSAGGQVEIPFTENPDGTYFAMFRDKFGIEWIIKFDA
jgi:PhnB protein